MTDLTVMALVLGGVALVRDRIASWPVTGPMLFVGAGVLLGPDLLSILQLGIEDDSVALAAEMTLVMLLFSDASRIDTPALRRSLGLPLRLLGIGLPITIGLGTVVTAALLSDLSWAEAGLVAAILAPTDAALGQPVVTNERVPVRVRQALNVESGVNDGLVVPVVAVFSVLAVGGALESSGALVGEAALEVLVGLAVGAAAGVAVGFMLRWANLHNWTGADGLRLVAFAGALGGFGLATAVGGNGFIAAFACGIALHHVIGEDASRHAELAEDIGQIGASATFVIFGATMVIPALEKLSWPVLICALLTLTIGRMLPVALATIGADLMAPTVAFLGWFGPRGLASMLFGLILVSERGSEVDGVFSVITLVILGSVVLHGATAAPGAAIYAKWFGAHGHASMAESVVVPEVRNRGVRDR